jgi:hypothetical protein
MKTRFRIGPFTFGKSGVRFSSWRRGTGVSVPLTNRRKNRSFGKLKVGPFSFYFRGKKSKKKTPMLSRSEYVAAAKRKHKQAYEPWSPEADIQLIKMFRQGKTIHELSETFGRTKGAIRARINKLLMQ